MKITQHLVPQFNQRTKPVTMLIIHSYASENIFESCKKNEVSSHYEIDISGNISQLVKEENRAWHAGKGFWRGMNDDINSSSIGIEVWNKTLGQSPFPQVQIENLIKLCQNIIDRHNIKPENIVGHSDIAPDRKPDPGHFFPWSTLAAHKIGLWYDIKNANKIKTDNIAELLGMIGYNTEDINSSSYAFCRRFLPEYITTDPDIYHLVDNVLPQNYDFIKTEKFLKTLKATAYEYNKI